MRTRILKIHKPAANLGCVGVEIFNTIYFDLYSTPHWGMFIRIGKSKYTISRRFRKCKIS